MDIIITLVIILAVLAVLLIPCYRKAPPNEAIVVTGAFHREPKVVSGRGVFVLPLLQRADRLNMRMMKLDVKTPSTGVKTSEGVPLWMDSVVTVQVYCNSSTLTDGEVESLGCKNREQYIKARQQAAISNFLGMNEAQIDAKVNDVLQGNLREIVSEMTVDELLTKRKEFATRVIENARPDLAKVGLEVITFNIQDIQDAQDGCGKTHGVVEAIGVQREMEVKKAAEIARADADRDITLARAKAARDANEGQVAADTAIAENNNTLALRKSALKAEADKAAVDAEAAGKIQRQIQEKTLREREADADIAAQEKAIIRTDKEVEVQKRRLSAEIREKADADKYAANAKADAERYAAEAQATAERVRRQNEADAELYETQKQADARKAAAEAARFAAEQEAEGIRAKGEAEAEAIRAKALAEAEGVEKKAKAQALMGDASKLEMMYNVLPQVAQALASSLNGVENLTMYGTDANSEYIGKITQAMNGFVKAMADGTGIRLGAGLAGVIPGVAPAANAENTNK